MKNKRGKGRKPRRLQKVFKMKKGSPFKFMMKGGQKLNPFGNPVPVGISANERVKQNLQAIGFRIKGGDR